MNRRTLIAALTSSAMLSLPVRASAQTLTTVRLGGAGNDDMVPVLYAMDSGIFKKAGLDVQIQSRAVGPPVAAAVASGALDMAKSSLMALMTSYDHGVKFKMVVGAAIYSSEAATTQIAVLNTSSIKTLADLSGKTGAVPALRELNSLGTLALIDKSGGNSATVKFVETPYPAMLPALERGTVDFAEIAPPFLSVALESGKIRTIEDPFAGIGNPTPISAWFTTQEYFARNPLVVQRFATIVREATAYTLSHLAETLPLLAEYSKIEADVLRKQPRTPLAALLNESQIQHAIDLAAKYKYISRSFPAKEILV